MKFPEFNPANVNWREKTTYREVLVESLLNPLELASQSKGTLATEIQRTVIKGLHWYFTLDSQARAPTVVVNAEMATGFHDIVTRIMSYVDVETLMALDEPDIGSEIRQALLSYKKPQCHSSIAIDAYDHDQHLVRLTYFVHGDKPTETFLLDGKPVMPAFAKYRACNYFRRMLLRQRIVWLPIKDEIAIEVLLDGKLEHVSLTDQHLIANTQVQPQSTRISIESIRNTYPPNKIGKLQFSFDISYLKTILMRWLASIPTIRKHFNKAWVFSDRIINADDNAEELYRWVKNNHPSINAWFLLSKDSEDWMRLEKERFRLIAPGFLCNLLLIHSEHVISSHADNSHDTFKNKSIYKLMSCRFSFIPHGISKDNVSHWLNPQCFDFIASTSPAEYQSFITDDTPYIYTKKEVSLTGFPRQDNIRRIATHTPPAEINILLIMPTWRASLVDSRCNDIKDHQSTSTILFNSNYISSWRNLLNNKRLLRIAQNNNLNLVFMPHINAIPFLSLFCTPKYIHIEKMFSKHSLCKSIALITDFTSVAFEMAALRRQTFYYQFDRESFYGGNHNWREGYFDYDRDGFGPVAFCEEDLIDQITLFLENGAQPAPEYRARMERAIPELDGRSCERVFECISNIRKPYKTENNHAG